MVLLRLRTRHRAQVRPLCLRSKGHDALHRLAQVALNGCLSKEMKGTMNTSGWVCRVWQTIKAEQKQWQ